MIATYNTTDNADITTTLFARHVVPGTAAAIIVGRYDFDNGAVLFIAQRGRGEVNGEFAFNELSASATTEAKARAIANEYWVDGAYRARTTYFQVTGERPTF